MTEPNDVLYLDTAVSTPPRDEGIRASTEALERFADPGAHHLLAREARSALELARTQVADALGAQSDELVFTSGGTEANALAVLGTIGGIAGSGPRAGDRRFVTTALEHRSVTDPARAAGLQVIEVGCDETGRVDVDRWAEEIARPGVVMASIQHASHLVGSINGVAECIRSARPHGVPVHVDACQTLAALPLDAPALGADLLSVSAHKAYGPPGVGALFVRRGTPLSPLLMGDERERRLRAGMPNLSGVAGMGAALDAARSELPDRAAHLWSLTDRLRAGLAEAGIHVLGHPTQRVPHIVTWSVPEVDAETLLMTLEDRGILTSTVPTEPLAAAGLAAPGDVVVRFGLWPGITDDGVDRVLAVVPSVVRDLGAIDYGPLRGGGSRPR
jgi:cysteine desulfurase